MQVLQSTWHHQMMKSDEVIAFPLDLFTQATYNAQMKIIVATQIQVLLASNNSHHFTFIPISHPSKYLPNTTRPYLLAWSSVRPTPPICPSQCSNEKNASITFSLDLFTQATCNAKVKIIATTQIQVLFASNNRCQFIFVPTSHLGRYLPHTTQPYLLAWSLVRPTPLFAH